MTVNPPAPIHGRTVGPVTSPAEGVDPAILLSANVNSQTVPTIAKGFEPDAADRLTELEPERWDGLS